MYKIQDERHDELRNDVPPIIENLSSNCVHNDRNYIMS